MSPKTRPPVAKLSPSELDRRERNRSKVRRSYYRKISNLHELRSQVNTLENKYEQLLQTQEARAVAFQTLESDDVEAQISSDTLLDLSLEPLEDLEALNDLEPVDPPLLKPHTPIDAQHAGGHEPESRERRLLQLARVRKSLYAENETLRDRQMEFAKAYGSLQHLVDVRAEDDELARLDVKRSQLLVVRRFTMAECLELSRVAYSTVRSFFEAQLREARRGKPPIATSLGWMDSRQILDGVLFYCFSKSFMGQSSATLAEQTWQLATNLKRVRHFYSHYLDVHVYEVQRIDANNLVCMRTVNQADHDVVLKSCYLLTRFETDKGVMLLWHSLDPSRLEDDFATVDTVGKAEVWQDTELFSWILLEDEADGSCQVSNGGAKMVEQPWEQFWLTEVLLLALRWETALVAPLFTLRCT